MDFSCQTAPACLPRRAARTPRDIAGATTFVRVYPGQAAQCRSVRAATRAILPSCPIADDVIVIASELAANACLHSRSGLPGGCFTLDVRDHPGDHVYVGVTDQGSDWDGDLDGITA